MEHQHDRTVIDFPADRAGRADQDDPTGRPGGVGDGADTSDQAGDEQPGDEWAGDDFAVDEWPGDEPADDDLAGDEQPGDEQPGDDLAGDERPGHEPADEEWAGHERADEELVGDGGPGVEAVGTVVAASGTAEPGALSGSRPYTGRSDVDEIVDRLDQLADLPPTEHVEVFDSIHRRLHETLLAAGEERETHGDPP